jgi:hypothetical protein
LLPCFSVGYRRKSSRALVDTKDTKRPAMNPFRVFGAVQREMIPTGLKIEIYRIW